ncbi:MAG: hypothetical protein Pars92KO_00440 [Parasphingorhabdus sp.]
MATPITRPRVGIRHSSGKLMASGDHRHIGRMLENLGPIRSTPQFKAAATKNNGNDMLMNMLPNTQR